MTSILLALVLWATPGPNPYLGEARMRYQNLEYEATLDLLKQAMSWSGTVDEELAQIHLLRGLCNLQMGREANGKAAFRAALLADSAVQLPPMTSPKIRQVFQLESESLSRARPPAPPAAPDPRRPADAPLSPVAGSPRATAEPVPALEVAPPVPPAPEKKVGEPVRWPAFATLGAAVLAVGIGAGFGYAAKDSADQSFAARYASDQGRLNQQAKDQAKVANGLYGAAAGLAVLGGVFFFVF